MRNQAVNSHPLSPGFRYLLLGTSILTYFLILLGIILRVTGTGSACPDWPACSGGLLPAVGTPALVPQLHRLVAVLAGLLLSCAVIIAWRRYRRYPWIVRPLLIALALSAVQIILGGILVQRGSLPHLVALHLGLAFGVQALVIVPAVIGFSSPERPELKFTSPFSRLSLWMLVSLFLLVVSGTWVAASGAAAACSGWPLCAGRLLPDTTLGWINLIHRIITLQAGLLMAAFVIQAWRTQRNQTAVLVATTAAGVLFLSQALMGAFEVSENYPAYLLGLHVATAAAVWGSLAVQVTLVGISGGTREQEGLEKAFNLGRSLAGIARDFLMLTKPIVVALLLVTTFAGMVLGGEAWPSLKLVFWTLLGGALAAGGSGAINQYIDRFDDVKMQRTAQRPIPSGRLTPGEGLAFGVAAALISFYLMVVFVNFLAALLTLAGIIYYVLLYSLILKKATVQNIVIGGGAGAIPPLVGWAAVSGSLNVPSLFLFAVVFMWTPPHFWALALVRRNDYARAGVPMLPVVRGEQETRWQIFLYTIELVALTLVLPLFGLGGGIYLVSAALLGGGLLYSAWKVWRSEGNKVAWKMYRHSSMYLAFLFLALMVDALL
jgi:protoheme IX farnesyltransferase